jgi:hypothetical protein
MNDATLTRIRQKELELQASLLLARQQAESLIHAANQQTADIRSSVENETALKLERLRADVAGESEREVAEVRAEYSRQADSLAAAAELIPALTRHIVDAVASAQVADPTNSPLASQPRR